MSRPRKIDLTVAASSLPMDPEALAGASCLRCGELLDLHQPGMDLPDRLLGSCPDCCDHCGSWHILNPAPDGKSVVMILLPDCRTIYEGFHAARPRGRQGGQAGG